MMKIFIDIGHPAHVHYFKNFIKIMEKKESEFLISARNKDCTHELLENYGIDYIDRGAGNDSFIGKFLYMLQADYMLWQKAKVFNPDIFLSFASPYAAQVSKLLNKPHYAFDDTEHAKLTHKLYRPFTDKIFISRFYNGKRTSKMNEYEGLIELAYLHPNYFEPDPGIYKYLNIDQGEKYVFLRFISWGAQHDKGQRGLSDEIKIKAVHEFKKEANVFISSEGDLPADLKQYQIKLPPHMIHHVLYYASLYFGESGTMATESAILGTPTVRVSSLAKLLGNFQVLKNEYRLIEYFDSDKEGFERAHELLKNKNAKDEWQQKAKNFIEDKVDVTQLMIDKVEEFQNNR